jgi:hypothetical protein
VDVLDDKSRYLRPPEVIARSFSPGQTARAYVRLFENLQQGARQSHVEEPQVYERLRQMNEKETDEPAPGEERPAAPDPNHERA